MEYIDGFKLPFFIPKFFSNSNELIYKMYQVHVTKNGKQYKEYDRNKWF